MKQEMIQYTWIQQFGGTRAKEYRVNKGFRDNVQVDFSPTCLTTSFKWSSLVIPACQSGL